MRKLLGRTAVRGAVILRARPLPLAVAGLLLMFFFYSVQRTLVTTAGYRLAKLQEEHRRLLNENHYLRWRQVRAVSRESLDAKAKESGLRTPKPDEEVLVMVGEGN